MVFMINKVEFSDIINEFKKDINLNIYQLCFNLQCSDGVIYRRITAKGFKGLTDVKRALNGGLL